MAALKVWLADKDGYYVGELYAPDAKETFAEYAANAAKNGQTAIDATVVGAVRPADRPSVPDPLKASYAAATTDAARIDILAQRASLK